MPLIELDHITFSYTPDSAPVLRDLSLQLESGACLAVTGENGAGKTTLFRILNGLSFPQSGHYRFDGTEITASLLRHGRQAKQFHKRIGFLFQNPDIMLFNATVYDEIAFGPRQLGLSDAEVDTRVHDCMELFRLQNLTDKAPYHLSGGQKKRAALAAVVSLNPDVLILDEPDSGLDRKNRALITEFLQGWKAAGKTLILATHDAALQAALADELLELPDEDEDEDDL